LHKPVVLVLQRCSGILQCQDLVLSSLSCLPTSMGLSCVGVTVALGVSSVMVSGLACGSGTRAPLWPILPSTDTRVVSVVLRVRVLRSTHNSGAGGRCQTRTRAAGTGTVAPRALPVTPGQSGCRLMATASVTCLRVLSMLLTDTQASVAQAEALEPGFFKFRRPFHLDQKANSPASPAARPSRSDLGSEATLSPAALLVAFETASCQWVLNTVTRRRTKLGSLKGRARRPCAGGP
jgi:hypothetical protein